MWYKNAGTALFCFVTYHVFERQTDRQIDSFLIARSRLRTMHRGKSKRTIDTHGDRKTDYGDGGDGAQHKKTLRRLEYRLNADDSLLAFRLLIL